MYGILQIKRFHNRREIVGIGIHIIPIRWLARSSVAAPVVGDTAISTRGKKKHLVFKSVRAQGPAVAENDGLSGAPVFVVNPSSVFH
jgi:hypothetical protein